MSFLINIIMIFKTVNVSTYHLFTDTIYSYLLQNVVRIISEDQTIQFDVLIFYMATTVKDIVTLTRTAVRYVQSVVLGQKVNHSVFKNQIMFGIINHDSSHGLEYIKTNYFYCICVF